MINELAAWHTKHAEALAAEGIETQFSTDPTDRTKRAARLDLKKGSAIGTVLLWTNGDCELDVLAADAEEMTSEYRELESALDVDAAIRWVIERL